MVTSTAASAVDERAARGAADKFAERRAQLAEAALKTLGELGYARTSLREIAKVSDFSHGVLHYYFADKVDLITACVRQYKARCVTRYDDVVATATTAEGLRDGFGAALVATMRDEAPMHRLWYDLRSQSLFEPAFRADVAAIDASLEQMVWRVLARYAELAGEPVAVDPPVAYAALDGLFQQALLRHLSGDASAGDHLLTGAASLLDRLVPSPKVH
ncbi:TetR/AcrR family transcriptional regulator [Angustibacter speluncae]